MDWVLLPVDASIPSVIRDVLTHPVIGRPAIDGYGLATRLREERIDGRHISPCATEHFNCGACRQSRARGIRPARYVSQTLDRRLRVAVSQHGLAIESSPTGKCPIPASENNALVAVIGRHTVATATSDRRRIGTRVAMTEVSRMRELATGFCGARTRREEWRYSPAARLRAPADLEYIVILSSNPVSLDAETSTGSGVGWPSELNLLVPCDGYRQGQCPNRVTIVCTE